ncbi:MULTISPECIES: 3-oxoacyl-[acyl-carrier-protein] reductase [unclassified Fusibacter]|uniref:3-oxoacyl-[acyl-carrier-protein] reductase n=1 Tax=unclassified Fusibacter TaxID=2624464 RepID=UPI0010114E47|nr:MULTISPECIES: 3-oxoacyl-[acyl-carrier-protein] reductase [unclassified Fusibacter]MCK8058077.1 3-oxoacyl-[acyl-carrier-protein] reductase [Fusibacter sp. A2]NPE20659.1 3-oxoacyl-[acyl-carrier-protein] reductase [Fusibacter sp. A1]RXV62865.1 3-oxoacyl-[acyl-carrier-protein] reductase [Fusibacter sp. A1]
MNLTGKNAIITGGSRGIGRAIALKLASLGANVVVNYTSSDVAALEVVKEAEELGVKALAIKADVSIGSDVEALVSQVKKEFGSIDILINNAGITRDGLLIRMKEDDWDKVLDINLKGVFNATKHVGKIMLKQKTGKIVNITSVVGIMGNAGQANYAASKAGVIGFTKSVAKEFASRGININAIAPGFIRSDMTDTLSDEVKENYFRNIPMGALGETEDVANAVAFLCSDLAKYITGQTLNVDGGLVM